MALLHSQTRRHMIKWFSLTVSWKVYKIHQKLLPKFACRWHYGHTENGKKEKLVGWLCWGLTSQSTIFQSCRDGAIASWVINQYFRGVKCLAQGHNTAAVGFEPRTSRSGVRHSTTEPPRSPKRNWVYVNLTYLFPRIFFNNFPQFLFTEC